MSARVVVVPTGTANLASVVAALGRAGAAPEVCAEPGAVAVAAGVVVPGVGTVAAAIARLRSAGLTEPLRTRIAAGLPTLAVCVGLQLLAEGSDESPGAEGLGVIPGVVRRFRPDVRAPQLGWNRVRPQSGCALVEDGDAFFANSYRLEAIPPGWTGALSDHGGPFVAALERGPVLACQFHPELSGAFGAALLRRWVGQVTAPRPSRAEVCRC